MRSTRPPTVLGPRRPLSCRELVELVTAYLEDTLPRGERRRFERHIAGCTDCSAHLQALRTTLVLLGELREEQLEPRVRADLLEHLGDWRDGE